jgi:hypothetical protein
MPGDASPFWSRRLRRLALLCLALAISACARGMEIGSEPSVTYRIVVANELGEAMIVSSDHAGSSGILGSVPAGSSDTFILARPRSLDVRITARNAAGTRTVGPIPVQLRAAEAVHVRLR